MAVIREIEDREYERLAEIAAQTYPRIPAEARSAEALRKRGSQQGVHFFGCFRNGRMLAMMRLHDFSVYLRGGYLPMGGVGFVGVDLLHKKQHICRDMLQFFLQHNQDKKVPLVGLYAFRPDFYHKMGFGFGPKRHCYRFKPAAIPRRGDKSHLRFMTGRDREGLDRCYRQWLERHNGHIVRTGDDWDYLLNPKNGFLVGYEHDSRLQGYLVGAFRPGHPAHFMHQHLEVSELVYNTPAALNGLLTFLHDQADQVDRVLLLSYDGSLHHLCADPRNGNMEFLYLTHQTNVSGVGIMYRVIDVPGMFRNLRHYRFPGPDLRLAVTVSDSFLPDNQGTYTLAFEQGKATQVSGACDARITLGIQHLSSLIVGAVSFKRLYWLGLAGISDVRLLDQVDRLFLPQEPGGCLTLF